MGNVNYSIEKTSAGHLKDTFVRAYETASVSIVSCGDVTDYGLPEEAAILAQDIRAS